MSARLQPASSHRAVAGSISAGRINVGAEPDGRFGDGWLYVLPRHSFRPEPRWWGVLDYGQWASPTPVRPLARIPVTADDFPFIHRVLTHRLEEKLPTTVLRATRLGRLLPSGHRSPDAPLLQNLAQRPDETVQVLPVVVGAD